MFLTLAPSRTLPDWVVLYIALPIATMIWIWSIFNIVRPYWEELLEKFEKD